MTVCSSNPRCRSDTLPNAAVGTIADFPHRARAATAAIVVPAYPRSMRSHATRTAILLAAAVLVAINAGVAALGVAWGAPRGYGPMSLTVVSLVPDLVLLIAPVIPGTNPPAVISLMLMHLVVVGCAVPAYVLASRGRVDVSAARSR